MLLKQKMMMFVSRVETAILCSLLSLSFFRWSLVESSGPSTLIGIVGRNYVLLGADTAYSGNGGISLTSSDLDKIHTISHKDDRRNPMLAAVASSNDLAHAQRFVQVLKANVIMREYQDGLGNDVLYVHNSNYVIEDLGWNVANMAEFARTQILPSCSMLLGGVMKKQNTKQKNPVFLPSAIINGNHNDNNSPHHRLQTQIKVAQNDYKLTETTVTSSVSSNTEKEEEGEEQNEHGFSYQPQLYCLDETQCLIRQCKYSAQGYGSNFVLSILDRNYDPNMTLEEAIELLNDCYQQLATRFVLNAPKPPTMKCIQYDKKSHRCVIRNISSSQHKIEAQKR